MVSKEFCSVVVEHCAPRLRRYFATLAGKTMRQWARSNSLRWHASQATETRNLAPACVRNDSWRFVENRIVVHVNPNRIAAAILQKSNGPSAIASIHCQGSGANVFENIVTANIRRSSVLAARCPWIEMPSIAR